MMTVRLIAHTPEPEKVVAAAAKLCYSDAHITDLLDGLDEEKTARFLTMLSDLGHASPIEHASFTFGIEGVSRTLLAQITRHRIASFSVQSQRYVRLDDFRYVIPPEIEAIPVRTLPYKKHSTDSISPDVKANAQRILSQMVAQSMGVVDNINGKEDYVHIGGNPNDYKLDALFVAGYNVANSAMFNDTNNYHGNPPQAHIDNQSHFSHGVELISALMMIDAINNPELGLQKGTKAIYGYNAEIDPANPNKTLTSKDLFNSEKTDVPVEPDPVGKPPIQLDLGQKIKVAVHLYAFLLQFQKDLTKISNDGAFPTKTFKKLFNSMYNVGFLMGGGTVNFPQIGRMSAKFSNYINAGRELTRFVYEIQKNTLFGNANPVINILPQTALENLINDPDNPDFNFSLGELYIKGDDGSYDTIVTLLQKLGGVVLRTVVISGAGERDDDEATAILINLIYQQIYDQLSNNGAI